LIIVLSVKKKKRYWNRNDLKFWKEIPLIHAIHSVAIWGGSLSPGTAGSLTELLNSTDRLSADSFSSSILFSFGNSLNFISSVFTAWSVFLSSFATSWYFFWTYSILVFDLIKRSSLCYLRSSSMFLSGMCPKVSYMSNLISGLSVFKSSPYVVGCWESVGISYSLNSLGGIDLNGSEDTALKPNGYDECDANLAVEFLSMFSGSSISLNLTSSPALFGLIVFDDFSIGLFSCLIMRGTFSTLT